MPKTDIDRLNLLNSNEKVDLELALLDSDYTYRQNKGGVASILNTLGETDAYKTGGWNALSQTAQSQINKLRSIGKKPEEPVEEAAPAPTSEELLTEIRDLLKEQQK